MEKRLHDEGCVGARDSKDRKTIIVFINVAFWFVQRDGARVAQVSLVQSLVSRFVLIKGKATM